MPERDRFLESVGVLRDRSQAAAGIAALVGRAAVVLVHALGIIADA